MWNLTSRPRSGDPHCWTNRTPRIGTYKEIDNSLIMMPDKLNEDAEISILRARAVIPTIDNSALMQLAEMCVYYQASSTSRPSGS